MSDMFQFGTTLCESRFERVFAMTKPMECGQIVEMEDLLDMFEDEVVPRASQ